MRFLVSSFVFVKHLLPQVKVKLYTLRTSLTLMRPCFLCSHLLEQFCLMVLSSGSELLHLGSECWSVCRSKNVKNCKKKSVKTCQKVSKHVIQDRSVYPFVNLSVCRSKNCQKMSKMFQNMSKKCQNLSKHVK